MTKFKELLSSESGSLYYLVLLLKLYTEEAMWALVMWESLHGALIWYPHNAKSCLRCPGISVASPATPAPAFPYNTSGMFSLCNLDNSSLSQTLSLGPQHLSGLDTSIVSLEGPPGWLFSTWCWLSRQSSQVPLKRFSCQHSTSFKVVDARVYITDFKLHSIIKSTGRKMFSCFFMAISPVSRAILPYDN